VAIILGIYFGVSHKSSTATDGSPSGVVNSSGPNLSRLNMVEFRKIVESSSTRVLSATDMGSVISLNGTNSFFLQLQTNPSTGYSLIVDNTTINGVFAYDSLY